jgi:glucose/arabinose dehydrogenase
LFHPRVLGRGFARSLPGPPQCSSSDRTCGSFDSDGKFFYVGANEDPRHPNARPDLKGHVTVPDVLLQPHSAPLGLAFDTGKQFPAAWEGDAFVALHGSWNRSLHTGYKIVRLPFHDGKPTGEYQDFVVGFTAGEENVWGRPVDVAFAHDGALLFSEDDNGVIYRVTYTAK